MVASQEQYSTGVLMCQEGKLPGNKRREMSNHSVSIEKVDDDHRVMVVPKNGQGWTTVGGDSEAGHYVGFTLTKSVMDDVSFDGRPWSGEEWVKEVHRRDGVMGQWGERDLCKWADGKFDSLAMEMPDEDKQDAQMLLVRYLYIIQELSVILRDNLVKGERVN